MLRIFTNAINKLKRNSQKLRLKRDRVYHSGASEHISLGNRVVNFFKDRSRMGLVSIFLIIIIGVLVLFIRSIYAYLNFQPQISKFSLKDQMNSWNGSEKLTILLIGTDQVDAEHTFIDHLSVYSLDPREKQVSIFILNPDIKVTQATLGVTLHYRTLLNNRKLEEDKIEMLSKSIENLLAIKIDRYILADKNTFAQVSGYLNPIQASVPKAIKDPDLINLPAKSVIGWEAGQQSVLPVNYLEFAASDANGRDDQFQRQQELLESISQSLIGFRSLLYFPDLLTNFEKYINTNMGKWELLSLGIKLQDISSDSFVKGYLREFAYEKVIDVGFYDAVSPDIALIDKDLSNIFFDLKLFKEQARIEILNASGIRGLANNRRRWVQNIGGRVIHVGNSVEAELNNKIYCREPEKYPVTITELKRFLGEKTQIIAKEYPNRHVGDIVVVLGSELE